MAAFIWTDDTEHIIRAVRYFAEILGRIPDHTIFSDFDTKTQRAILQKAQEYKNEKL